MRIIHGRSRSGRRGGCSLLMCPIVRSRRVARYPGRSMSETIELPRVGGPGTGPGGSWRVIVRNDDHNTFEHVARTLARFIPGVTLERGHEIANVIHSSGQAIVYTGHQEPAEHYWEQLKGAGLTMAPLEQAELGGSRRRRRRWRAVAARWSDQPPSATIAPLRSGPTSRTAPAPDTSWSGARGSRSSPALPSSAPSRGAPRSARAAGTCSGRRGQR